MTNSVCFRRGLLVAFLCMFFPLGCLFAVAESEDEGCSVVSGEYFSAGESDSHYSEYFEKPLLERNVFGVEHSGVVVHSVRIALTEKSPYMQLEFIDKEGGKIFDKKWSEDFVCAHGSLTFESNATGGGDGSSVRSVNTVTTLSKTGNGTLTVHSRTKTKYRSWIFFEKESVFEVNYTFGEIRNY